MKSSPHPVAVRASSHCFEPTLWIVAFQSHAAFRTTFLSASTVLPIVTGAEFTHRCYGRLPCSRWIRGCCVSPARSLLKLDAVMTSGEGTPECTGSMPLGGSLGVGISGSAHCAAAARGEWSSSCQDAIQSPPPAAACQCTQASGSELSSRPLRTHGPPRAWAGQVSLSVPC